MHLRNKQAQKTISALRQSGHVVVVMKPGEIEGMPRGVAEQRMRDAVGANE